jgi:Bacterial protein of unknown function (DUF916)
VNRFAQRLAVGSVVLLTAMVAAPSVAMAAPPAAAAGGGVSLAPAYPSTASPSYFTFHAKAGTTVHDALVVTNHGNASVSLAVSPVDGLTGQTSGSVYANRTDPIRKAGRWVTPAVSALTLAAGATRTIDFTVAIPAGTVAGDHLAGIAVENTVPTESSNGFAIKQILRNVIGVLVVVPGKATFVPSLSSLGIQQIGATGIGSVTVGLGNSGLLLAHPTLAVSLSGPSGYQRSQTRVLDTVLPGDTITYPFAWPDVLAKGDYNVTATLTGGGTSVSMTRSVNLGAALAGVTHPLPTATTTQAATSGMQWWMWLAILLAAAIAFGGAAGTVIRHGHRSHPHHLDPKQD